MAGEDGLARGTPGKARLEGKREHLGALPAPLGECGPLPDAGRLLVLWGLAPYFIGRVGIIWWMSRDVRRAAVVAFHRDGKPALGAPRQHFSLLRFFCPFSLRIKQTPKRVST